MEHDPDVEGATITSVPRRTEPARVPASRYTSAAWAAREAERLWPDVWQIAGTVSQVASPGDWFEYRVGKLSVLVLRDDEGGLQAFQNVCLHRGNELCSGAGSGRDEIRCPYHRWAWDLQGRLREVPSRKGFGSLRNGDLPLVPVAIDTWGELVFVNLDVDADPLATWLEGVPDDIAWIGPDDYRCEYVFRVPLPCNWKTLIDAFSETYHVQGIHPELLPITDDVNSPQHLWDRHGKLEQPYGTPSPRLRGRVDDDDVWRGWIETQGERIGVTDLDTPRPPVPEGQTMRDVFDRLVREHAAAKGLDLGHLDQRGVLDLFQYNLFPNATVIYLADVMTAITATPGPTPDESVMTYYLCWRTPGPDSARSIPTVMDLTPDDAQFGLVFEQDVANLQRAQRGLHQPGFTHLTLSGEEARIINLHRNLERHLGIEPGGELPASVTVT